MAILGALHFLRNIFFSLSFFFFSFFDRFLGIYSTSRLSTDNFLFTLGYYEVNHLTMLNYRLS